MPTLKPERCLKPRFKMTDDSLFDLPSLPDDLNAEATPAPTFKEQMAHSQMLLSWLRTQGREIPHPPRNEEPFVMQDD